MKTKSKRLPVATVLITAFLMLLTGCHKKSIQHTASDTSALGSLERLVAGNSHFSNFQPEHPDETRARLMEVSKSQHPFAVVVCCSDSRLSPELIFDQGMGDLFVVRSAGNVMGGLEIGSIEYAVEHLGVKLIMIMGHENCGAIKAFMEGGKVPGHVKEIIDSLSLEKEIKAIPDKAPNRTDEYVQANILHGINQLYAQSALLKEKLEKKELQIVGARYDLDDLTIKIIKK